MRAPTFNISPLTFFWCAIYVLVLVSIYAAGILKSAPGARPSPLNQSEATTGSDHEGNLHMINQLKS